jgi:hypothetical protein
MKHWPLFLPVVGCSAAPSVAGTVGGEEIELIDGFFFAGTWSGVSFGGEDYQVWLSGLPDACSTIAALQEQALRLTDPEALAALWSATVPPDYWEIQLGLHFPTGGFEFFDDGFLEAPGVEYRSDNWVSGTLYHYTEPLDAAWFSGESDAGLEAFTTTGGRLDWELRDEGQRLRGLFVTDTVAVATGEPAGAVEISFDVAPCPALDEEL